LKRNLIFLSISSGNYNYSIIGGKLQGGNSYLVSRESYLVKTRETKNQNKLVSRIAYYSVERIGYSDE